jgi:hypothetical protein
MEQLQGEYERLRQAKIRSEADRENAELRLRELQERAEQEFGSSDPDELEAKLQELEGENETRTRDYEKHLQELDQAVRGVESRLRGDEESADER